MALPNNKWNCPACTYLNWSSSLKCSLCGSPRSAEVVPRATIAKIKSYTQNSLCSSKSLEKGSSPVESRSSAGDKWICSVCTFSNMAKASVCSMCQSLRVTSDDNGHGLQSYRSPIILDFVTSANNNTGSGGGAVGGVSVDPIDVNVKKHQKQRHSSENKSKRWKCANCTYENYQKSFRCSMCGMNRMSLNTGLSSAVACVRDDSGNGSHRRKVASSRHEDVRQIRNRLAMIDWLFLHACEGITKGDISSVKEYLKSGGDKLRQLSTKEVSLLDGQFSKYTSGSSLIDLALRFHESDILAYILTPAPAEAHKRLPSQSDIDLAAMVRSEVSSCLRQKEGDFPCYFFSEVTTFSLPKEVNSFCECTRKKIMEEVLDLDVLKVLEKENSVINWSTELIEELHSGLYPLWNRTAGDCLLDSILQATWGVSDRDSILRKALANSLTECSSEFYKVWHDAEVFTAETQGFSLDENQLKADWLSIVSLADHKGRSLDQAHVFVLAHILRRPILVYGVKVVENFRGEKLGPVNYEGVYLPLLWESSFCSTTPIALAYTRGHFSSLVSIACTDDGLLSCDNHVTYLPLVDNKGNQLPVHFLSEHQLGCEDHLLKEYCDYFVTKKGLRTIKQYVKPEHSSHHVIELVENWMDRFYQLNKKCQSCND